MIPSSEWPKKISDRKNRSRAIVDHDGVPRLLEGHQLPVVEGLLHHFSCDLFAKDRRHTASDDENGTA
jgi:hypothetical protein